MSVAEALTVIDKTFGIEAILRDEGRDILRPYYIQSEPGYKRVHSQQGCMHVALNPDGQFDPDSYLAQVREVATHMRAIGARKVLELGSGMGFNTLALAPQFQGVQFTGLDLMDHHIQKSRAKEIGRAHV
jgi:tRNA G46 methylase TrmB